jgi:hypothetical protein
VRKMRTPPAFARLTAMPDDRRERDRYGRASLGEQLGGELRSLRRNPALIILLIVLGGGWLFLTISRPEEVRIGNLKAGDCLYIHAADADPQAASGRMIGSDGAVTTALFEEGAERASCDLSHSHEVADAWILDDPVGSPYPGQAELANRYRARCESAFAAYVGHPVDGSIYGLTIAVPTPAAWERGAIAAACLVSQGDGTYLHDRAGGSGT